MKTKQEIKKNVEQARDVVKFIFADDARAKDAKNAKPDSGFARESDMVFQEVLRYFIGKEN
jgi:hypothetical protein